MILFFLMSGFPWITILIAIVAFVIGYYWSLRLQKSDTAKLDEIATKDQQISELGSALEQCRQRQEAYIEEINLLKASTQQNEVASEDTEMAPISEEEEGGQGDGSQQQDKLKSTGRADGPLIPDQKAETPKRASKFEALKHDDLQIVEGIGPKMEAVLKENGVQAWDQLGNQTKESLREILEKYGNKYKIIDPDSWPEQASFAAHGKWSQLVRMQKGLDVGRGALMGDTPAKIEKVMIKLGIIKEYKQDDLKAIEGIGPKIAELLNVHGINSWKDLANTTVNALQNILDKAGKRYQLADPATWPKQAELADAGKFDELSDYQEYLQGGI